jgi:hypothetical protein
MPKQGPKKKPTTFGSGAITNCGCSCRFNNLIVAYWCSFRPIWALLPPILPPALPPKSIPTQSRQASVISAIVARSFRRKSSSTTAVLQPLRRCRFRFHDFSYFFRSGLASRDLVHLCPFAHALGFGACSAACTTHVRSQKLRRHSRRCPTVNRYQPGRRPRIAGYVFDVHLPSWQ